MKACVVAAVLAGCSAAPYGNYGAAGRRAPGVVAFDLQMPGRAGLTTSDVADVAINAVEQWQAAIPASAGVRLMITEGSDDNVITWDANDWPAGTAYRISDGIVDSSRTTFSDEVPWSIDCRDGSTFSLRHAMLHEIGHALGLNHSNDPTSIMYPGLTCGSVLTQDDVDRIEELYQ